MTNFKRLCEYVNDRYPKASNDHKLKMLTILIKRDNQTIKDKGGNNE